MATLNVKNVPETLHKKLQRRAERERRSVSQEVIHILERELVKPKSLSILGLKGLGKEIWTGIDAGEHVEKERRSWD